MSSVKSNPINLLNNKSGRGLIAFAFYFAEGAPIGFIWWTMPTLLRQNGAGIDLVGTFTAILILPWVFKFLWAPLVDVLRSPRFGFIKWIGVSQGLMCLTLIPLIFIPLSGNILCWCTFLFIHSLCAATQDVSVDAMIINSFSNQETGMLNGYMQAGMLLGRSIFGGGALILISKFGIPLTVSLMVIAIFLTMILLLFIKEPAIVISNEKRLENFKKNLKKTLVAKKTWFTIAFALTAASAFEAAGAMSGPFLTDKKISSETIGFFFGVPVAISMLIGGFIGGFLSDRMSRKTSVLLFLFGFVLTVSSISVIGFVYPSVSHFIWISLFVVMYFFTGMFTTASYALFMDVSDPKLGATQFSTFMAATNGCESWVVLTAGVLSASHGYGIAFLVMCLVSVLSLFFLAKIKIK
ncbi:MAG: MFS transporter [Bacteroidota bacterium]|nr:MFS transporter [Bacteroidota bacterium]MDP3144717.1 MFS transporter [Bacteroidota bacterium]MDP3557906.1 MFS transporter [Bacteroidota bacterium]